MALQKVFQDLVVQKKALQNSISIPKHFHFRFELDLANNLEVEFLVYSWDPQLRHRLCYRSSMRLAALFGKGQTFQQVALRMHPAGTLYLTLRFTDLREAYDRSRNPPLPGLSPVVVPSMVRAGGVPAGVPKLFGCALEGVLERETSGFAVPLLVKRCTDEVEKRGLDIIGIYRLCGSETKKQMLRDAFEEAPELVDLSSENVPDINVITGTLKNTLEHAFREKKSQSQNILNFPALF